MATTTVPMYRPRGDETFVGNDRLAVRRRVLVRHRPEAVRACARHPIGRTFAQGSARTCDSSAAPGRAVMPPAPRPPAPSSQRDVDLGLALNRRVVRYTNDPGNKVQFLEREAREAVRRVYRRRSGSPVPVEPLARCAARRRTADRLSQLVQAIRSPQRADRNPRSDPSGRYIELSRRLPSQGAASDENRGYPCLAFAEEDETPQVYAAWRRGASSMKN